MEEATPEKKKSESGWYEFLLGVIPLIIFYVFMESNDFSNGITLMVSGAFLLCYVFVFGWMLEHKERNIDWIKGKPSEDSQ